MIYAQNQGITGINIHRKIIDRVYHGNRLVWLRNSTADSFTIVGDDTIVETRSKSYRVKYAGSDDIAYEWSFSGSDPTSVIYNHNHRKITITAKRGDYGKTMVITCNLTKKDGTVLTSTKSVLILEKRAIDEIIIPDVVLCGRDSSVYAPYTILPPNAQYEYEVVDASIWDTTFAIMESYTHDGATIEQTVKNTTGVIQEATYGVKIIDEASEVHSDTATVYNVNPVDYFMINRHNAGRGDIITDTIRVGVFFEVPITEYILNFGIGFDGYVDYGTDKPFMHDELREFYLNGSKYPPYNKIIWIGEGAPKRAVRTKEIPGVSCILISTNDRFYTTFAIPEEYRNIEGNNAAFIFSVRWDGQMFRVELHQDSYIKPAFR